MLEANLKIFQLFRLLRCSIRRETPESRLSYLDRKNHRDPELPLAVLDGR